MILNAFDYQPAAFSVKWDPGLLGESLAARFSHGHPREHERTSALWSSSTVLPYPP